MKKSILVLLTFLSISILSCDPDVAKQGVTYNPLNFELEHLPDTSYININDTIHFYGALPNNQKITGGKVSFKISFGLDSLTPITIAGLTKPSLNNIDHTIINRTTFIISNDANQNRILGLYTYPQEDSIRFDFSIVFHKKGTYGISLSPSFYEDENGKASVSAKFKSDNLGWELYQNGYPVPQLGDGNYHNKLTIAVTN